MSRPFRLLPVCLVVATTLGLPACDKVPLLAPTNTTIRLTTNVSVVPVNGEAEITAIVIESAGTPVQNGTVVTFSSSLGTTDPREARTTNGQATVRYLSGGQSGKASIGAFSGGAKAENLEILVGGAGAGAVSLRATSTVVPTTGGTVSLIATVQDTGGNPLRGAQVSFTATAGQISQSTVITDSAGEARTDLTTTRESTVTARVAGGSDAAKADLKIEARDAPVLDFSAGGKSAGQPVTWEAGIPVSFTLAPKATGNAIRSAVIDFGDGSTQTLGSVLTATTVVHTYARTGAYSASVRATDVLDFSATTTLGLTIIEKRTIAVTISPPSIVLGVASFTVTATAPAGDGLPTVIVTRYDWDFGDGTGTTTTGPTVSHRYNSGSAYTVRVTVFSAQGHTGNGETVVRP